MDFRNPWLIGKATWWSWYGLLTLLWQWCVENSMFAKLLSQPHGTSEHSTKPNIFPEKYWNQKIEWINPCQLAVPFNTDWFFRTNNVWLWTSFRVLGAQIRIRKSNLPHALRKACTRVHFGNYKLVFCIHDIESGLIEDILEHWIGTLYSMKLNKLFKSE